MGIGIIGKKLGMTQIFGDNGIVIPVTVVKAGPCFVVQKKTVEHDGYNAVQIGFDEITKVSRVNKPLTGHFKEGRGPSHGKAERVPASKGRSWTTMRPAAWCRSIFSSRAISWTSPGSLFGKGYAGVIKRHKFSGAPGGHGTHEFFRHGGSIGNNTTPGRTLKGKKMAGHMGARKVTVQSLKVVDVRGDTNIVMIEGAVPGPRNGYLILKKAVKKS